MVMGIGRNAGVVMPTAGQVLLDEVYGFPDTRTGTLDCDASAPAAPVITAVLDNDDADSVKVSLTTTPETNTLNLYYRQKAATPWTTGLTRVGSGNIDQTGLTPGIWYEMYATADNGAESAPSNLVTVYLAQADSVGTLKSAIYTILMGDETVQAIVDGRVTPGGDPVRGMTSIAFYMISSIRGHTMDGPDTLATPTLQVNSYGDRDYTADVLADAVRGALDGYNGTVNGVSISYMALNDEGDLDDYEPGNQRVSRHGVRQDYLVTYTEN